MTVSEWELDQISLGVLMCYSGGDASPFGSMAVYLSWKTIGQTLAEDYEKL